MSWMPVKVHKGVLYLGTLVVRERVSSLVTYKWVGKHIAMQFNIG